MTLLYTDGQLRSMQKSCDIARAITGKKPNPYQGQCKIGMNQIVFIELILSEQSVEPTEEKVRGVRETEPPTYQFQLKVLAKFCDNRRTTTKVDTTRQQVAAGKKGK